MKSTLVLAAALASGIVLSAAAQTLPAPAAAAPAGPAKIAGERRCQKQCIYWVLHFSLDLACGSGGRVRRVEAKRNLLFKRFRTT